MLTVDLRLDGILHVLADGVLTTEEYVGFAARFLRLAHPTSPILVELGPSFTGWGPGALWRDLKPDGGGRSGRLAVVGDRAWRNWSTDPDNLIFAGEVRFFEREGSSSAVAWLLEPSGERRA